MLDISPAAWAPLLESEEAAIPRRIVVAVSTRLRDPEHMQRTIAVAEQQSPLKRPVYWPPYGLAQGYAGLAIACGHLDRCYPGEHWDAVAHHYLTMAARGTETSTNVPMGLWSGLSGLAFAARYLSRDGARYRSLIPTLDAALLPHAVTAARQLTTQMGGASVSQFDVISGLAGIGAYLLMDPSYASLGAVLEILLSALVGLAAEEDGLPRWHTPPERMMDSTMLEQFPGGNLNCGLAHGIPGPLALLALARLQGISVDGIEDAMEYMANRLQEAVVRDAWGVNWPTATPLVAADPFPRFSRSAWCYGSAGVARALWLAGEALDRQVYRDLALDAMDAIFRRPVPERRIDSPTFCHGVAGLLQVTLRFARDTGLTRFVAAARELCQQLVGLHQPDSMLGYRSIELEGKRVDQPGLLDGAPGVMLSLLAAVTDTQPTWDRLFLLS